MFLLNNLILFNLFCYVVTAFQFLGGILIYPGTKWCGPGNKAWNDHDFGSEIATDKCCHAHDNCGDIMKGFQAKYNLRNPNFFTRLNCNCDRQFFKCLKAVNTKTANDIGNIYFNVIHTKCFSGKGKSYQWLDEQHF